MKRDRQGKPFGFVKFPDDKEMDLESFLRRLNNLWINNYKLRVYRPRYLRNQSRQEKAKVASFKADTGIRKTGISFKEAVIRGQSKNVEQRLETMDIEQKLDRDNLVVFDTKENERKLLKKCSVALLKDTFSWEEHGEEIQSECGKKLSLCYVGDNAVLINNISDFHMDEMIKNMDEWFSYWFEWVRPWKPTNVCHRRKIWTRWIGVPLYAWIVRFFTLASAGIGALVKMDVDAGKKTRMDFAQIMLSVPYLSDINQIVRIKIDEKLYKIKVLEEYPWPGDIISSRLYDKIHEEEFSWTDESRGQLPSNLDVDSVLGRNKVELEFSGDDISVPNRTTHTTTIETLDDRINDECRDRDMGDINKSLDEPNYSDTRELAIIDHVQVSGSTPPIQTHADIVGGFYDGQAGPLSNKAHQNNNLILEDWAQVKEKDKLSPCVDLNEFNNGPILEPAPTTNSGNSQISDKVLESADETILEGVQRRKRDYRGTTSSLIVINRAESRKSRKQRHNKRAISKKEKKRTEFNLFNSFLSDIRSIEDMGGEAMKYRGDFQEKNAKPT
ncbi:hypothetical protein ACS0TY_033324 [Phlomoides rotata]